MTAEIGYQVERLLLQEIINRVPVAALYFSNTKGVKLIQEEFYDNFKQITGGQMQDQINAINDQILKLELAVFLADVIGRNSIQRTHQGLML